MKKFKDLVKGDKVYILFYGRGSSKVLLRKATFDYSTIAQTTDLKTTLNLIFAEESESPICVESEFSVYISPLTLRQTNWLYYFSDILALESFIKSEIQELNGAIRGLEEIYNEAWATPTDMAGIYYDLISKMTVVYDGGNVILYADGSKYDDVYSEKTLRKAKPFEIREFLIECSETITKGHENKDLLLEVLKKSGYAWADFLKTFIHEVK